MTNEAAVAYGKISFGRGLAGVALALLFYVIGSAIVSIIASLPVYFLGLHDNLIAQTVQSVVVTIGGMWFARSALDWSLKRYSGRAVFIFFLATMLIIGTAFAIVIPLAPKVIAAFVQMVAIVATAYYYFWRRESETPEIIAERVEAGRTAATTVLGCLPMLVFLLYGLVQFSAVEAQVEAFTHLNSFFATGVSWVLAYIPLVGSIVGFFGAKDVWHWQWWQAAALYFGLPVGLYVILMIGGAISAMIQRVRRPA